MPRAIKIAAVLLLGAGSFAIAADPPETGEPAPAVPSSVEQPDESEGGTTIGGPTVPEGLQVEWRGKLIQDEDGTVTFKGPVTMTWQDTRIQGDSMSLREQRYLEVEGNALIVWGGTSVFGKRMSYDLKTERGIVEDAMGQTLDEYQFWAKSVEKIGEDRVRLKKATVTTCTQPVPYWSFAVSSATIHIDHYARMWNVRFRAGPAPILYLPFIVWPVKQDRAPGLLMPELHNSANRGQMYRQELFLPIGRSADLTLESRIFTEDVAGGGGKLRAIPNVNGTIDGEAFFVRDNVYSRQTGGNPNRYQVIYQQEQRFLNGFRMVADIDVISDPDYLADFRRDLNVASSPQTVARLEFARNGPWVSMNVRELRREQLSSGLVQQTLPEIEFRGRNKQLGKTPLYLSFSASGASIQQEEERSAGELPFRPDYYRGDLAPTLSLPYSPTPWFDITPSVSQRVTTYSQRQRTSGAERVVEDRSLTRTLSVYGVEIVGPKVSRVFRPEGESASQYKHAIEARMVYGYATTFDDADDILLYDEVDRVNGNGEQVNYSLVQRLFAKRPRSEIEGSRNPAESLQLPDGTVLEMEGSPEEEDDPDIPPSTHGEPLEIARFTVSQARSFDEDLSRTDVDGDGMNETSRYGPIRFDGRFNPARGLDIDLRSNYDILFDKISNVSVSGTLQNELARMRFSLVHRNGLGINSSTGEKNEDDTQVRLTSALTFWEGKVQLNVDGSYVSNPAEGTSNFPDQRWQLQYSTQCCTLFLERLTREFAQTEDRREVYFRVDLRGVGKILSSTFD